MIKRALDAGAHGIIVPLLNSVEDAKNIATYSKFPPTGTRGLGSGLSMEKFISGKTGEVQEVSMADYFRDANSATLVIAQIETKGALEQVDQIAAVEGIDVLLIGPTDLGNNIGCVHGSLDQRKRAVIISQVAHTNQYRRSHPAVLSGGKHSKELDEAIDKINKAAHNAGKKSAIYFGTGEQAKQYADMGFDMINAANDIAILKTYVGKHIAIANGKS